MMEPDDCTSEEFQRLLLEYRSRQRRHEEDLRRLGFFSESDWLARVLSDDLDGVRASEQDFLIAVRGAPLPTISECWTGLIVLDAYRAEARAWIHEFDGYFDDASARLRKGVGSIPRRLVDDLLALLQQGGLERFSEVPTRCYDGAPTELKLWSRKVGRVIETSANASDDGGEPTLILAKLTWKVKACINLTETIELGSRNDDN